MKGYIIRSYRIGKYIGTNILEGGIFTLEANKKWLSIPKEMRKSLLANVWCGNCSDVTEIVAFIVEDHEFGVVLKGKCKKCGHGVARVIEED